MNGKSQLSIVIASDQERDEDFAEIYCGDEQWAEIIFKPESQQFVLEIFPPQRGRTHVFRLREIQAILEKARERLVQLGYNEVTE